MYVSSVNLVVRIIASGCWTKVIEARLFVKRLASGRSQAQAAQSISVADAVKFLADHPDAIMIEAHSPSEVAAGHLLNAKNYNLTDDATCKDVLAKITDKTKWYLAHSAAGHCRTVRALEYFEANGFKHAVTIDGGYRAWKDTGQPIVKDVAGQLLMEGRPLCLSHVKRALC
jgi:rhodanese-related sulfurtransferase